MYKRILNGNHSDRRSIVRIGHYYRYVTALECTATIYDRRRSFQATVYPNCANNSRRSTVIRLFVALSLNAVFRRDSHVCLKIRNFMFLNN